MPIDAPRMNLAQYINPGNPSPLMDITAAYRQWQGQHLDEDRLAEQKRQFDQNQAEKQSEFSQEMGYKNRVSNDINSRFGLEMGEKTNLRGYEQESSRYKNQLALLNKARASASQGRWNEVEAMMGSLKELGANVGRSTDQNGSPIYHLEAGREPTASGETFESAMSHINQNHGQSPQNGYQFNPEQPQISQQPQQRNPFDTQLGTTAQAVQQQPQPQQASATQPSQPTTVDQDLQHIQQELDGQAPIGPMSGQQSQQQPQQQSSQPFDPYAINSAQLNDMNQKRLQPLMQGIEQAFPNRFQPQIHGLLGGIGALGTSPESYLDALQKPMDTAARLMGAELNSEGQMARAGIQAGGQANSEARMRENEAYKRAEQAAKDYGVRQAIDNSQEMKQITEELMSENPNANADGIKALLALREGNRLTDKDFDIGATGYASNWDQAKQQLERTVHTGLTADQKSNFRQLIGMYLQSNQRRIATGSKKLIQYMNTFRNEPERYGVYNYIRGRIPDEYVTPELLNADPSRNFGGRTPGTTSKSKSVTATAPTTQQAVEAVKSLDDEGKEFE